SAARATTSPASSSPSRPSHATPAPCAVPLPDPSSMLVLQPLGDQAILVRCSSEADALRFSAAVRAAAPAWLIDVVQAYTTVAVFFSLGDVTFAEVSTLLLRLEQTEKGMESEGRLHEVPCCYE